MNRTIRIGISTCPNDTFAFHGLLTGRVTVPGIDLQFELLDVQQLNEKLFAGDFDVAKGSFHAAILLSDELVVLDAGSALGFGNGPLLLSSNRETKEFDSNTQPQKSSLVLCPGEHTTANLLYQLFYPGQGRIENVVFSEIMPALSRNEADLGVCIHEGRFTWQEEGLGRIADLGELWEERTGVPLPLGGIFARKNLGDSLQRKISRAIRASIEYGHAHRDETLLTMRKYAQEFTDEVLFSHVDLYVNDWTLSLQRGSGSNSGSGTETPKQDLGARSIRRLAELAREVGIIDGDRIELQIVG